MSRVVSSMKEDRVLASKVIEGPPKIAFEGDLDAFIEDIRQVGH
jgi:6-phosphogluconate dehydrogenase